LAARSAAAVANQYLSDNDDSRRVQGIGRTTGKALALSIIGVAVFGVVKLVDLVTD
jgi:hypothetical protein